MRERFAGLGRLLVIGQGGTKTSREETYAHDASHFGLVSGRDGR
jgi:hypothetical protein